MSSIDHRIVEMEFDNKQFEKGVSTTINSIDELKKKLQFEGVNKGFDQISKGFDGVNTSKLGSAIDAVTNKFSFLGTIGDQAIRTITNSITNKLLVALKEASNMLTGVSYSMEGFKEYELKIGSIQTIAANTGALSNLNKETEKFIEYSEEEIEVANKVVQGYYSVGSQRKQMIEALGYDYEKIQNKVNEIVSGVNGEISASGNNVKTTLADIDAALDDLNVYADKTIYSFSNMTQAIGKFTTAGIDLETSVEAVKGVSNLAALSGADNAANQRAMYNISQALQVGYMQLMDWRSIENAGMASAQFKEAIMETARVHGIAIDEMIKEEGSFNLTLQKKWLTNDILIESLAKLTAFTEDMTEEEREAERARWKEIGYTDEQIAAIEDLSRVAYESATKVRTFSQLVSTLKEEVGSSYTMMWQNIVGNFDEATNLWTGLHDAIQDNFLRPMAEARDAKWKFFHDNGGREAALEGFTNVGKSFLTIIKAITDAWKEVFPPDDGRRITALAKAFAEFSKKLLISDETAEKIKMTFKGLFSVLHIFTTVVKVTVKLIALLINAIAGLSSSGHPILELTSRLGGLLVKLDEFISDSDNIDAAIRGITTLLSKLWSVIEPLADGLSDIFKDRIGPKIQGVFSNLRDYIKGFVKGSEDDVNSMGESDTSGVETFGERIHRILGPILEKLQPVINIVKKIATLYFKAVKIVLGWAAKAFDKIKEILMNSADNISISALFEALLGVQAFQMMRTITSFFKSAEKSLVNFKRLVDGVNGVLNGVKDVLKAYVLDIKSNILLKIAGAVMMLCASLIALSQINADKLWEAMKAMSLLMVELTAMIFIMTKLSGEWEISKEGMSGSGILGIGTTLLEIAAALLMMIGAIAIVSKMGTKTLVEGLTGIIYILITTIAALFAMSKIMKALGSTSAIMGAGLALMEMATAINMLVIPLIALSFLPTDKLAHGVMFLELIFIALAQAMAMLAVVSKLVTAKSIMAVGLAVIELATAINMLVIPIILLGVIPYDIIIQGFGIVVGLLVALTACIALLAAAMQLASPAEIMAAGVALMSMAFAVQMLVPPLIIFGLMPSNVIKKGFLTMALMIAGLVAAMNFMPKDHDNIAKSLAAIALDIAVIAGSLILLAAFDWQNLMSAASSIATVLLAFAMLMYTIKGTKSEVVTLQMIAITIGVLAASIYALSQIDGKKLIIAVGAIAILIGVIVGLGAIAGYLFPIAVGIEAIGLAVKNFGMGMAGIGAGLALIAAAIWLLGEVNYDNIKLGKLGKEIAALITELLVGLINGLAKVLAALKDFIPTFIAYLVEGLATVFGILSEYAPELIEKLADLIVGVFDGLANNMGRIVDSIGRFITATFNAIGDFLTDEDKNRELTESIMYFLSGLVILMCNLCAEFVKVAEEIIRQIAYGIGHWYENSSLYNYFYDGAGQNAISHMFDYILDIVEDLGFADIGKAIASFISDGLESSDAMKYLYEAAKKLLTNVFFGPVAGKAVREFLIDPAENFVDSGINKLENLMGVDGPGGGSRRGEKTEEELAFFEQQQAISQMKRNGSAVGAALAMGVIDGYKSRMDIESPAKDEDLLDAGKYTAQGLLNGMKSILPDSTDGFVTSLTGQLKNKLGTVDVGSMVDTNSVIDLDSSGLDVSDYTSNINGTMDLGNTDFTNKVSMDVSDQMDKNQQDILETTNNIYSELASLRGYISEIKIQLDSGALVGSLVGPMDTALGERSAMKGRGV